MNLLLQTIYIYKFNVSRDIHSLHYLQDKTSHFHVLNVQVFPNGHKGFWGPLKTSSRQPKGLQGVFRGSFVPIGFAQNGCMLSPLWISRHVQV